MSALALNSQEDLTNFTKKNQNKQQETIKFFHVEQHNCQTSKPNLFP